MDFSASIQHVKGNGVNCRWLDDPNSKWWTGFVWTSIEADALLYPLQVLVLENPLEDRYTGLIPVPPGGPWTLEYLDGVDGYRIATATTDVGNLPTLSMAISYPDFIKSFPAFQGVEQATIEYQLGLSTLLLESGVWAEWYPRAVSLDAAHNLALTQIAASSGIPGAIQMASGIISSVSGAGVSTSFQTPQMNSKSMSEQWYSKTIFGQEFLRLRNVVIPMGYMAC